MSKKSNMTPLAVTLYNLLLVYVVYFLARMIYLLENWSFLAQGLTFSHFMEMLGGGLVFDTSAILVTNIPGEVDAANILILLMQLAYHLPSLVTTSIVDKYHHRVLRNQAFRHHVLEQGCQAFNTLAEHFFFVVTGRYGS